MSTTLLIIICVMLFVPVLFLIKYGVSVTKFKWMLSGLAIAAFVVLIVNLLR